MPLQKLQTPPFNHQLEINPLAQLICERDNLKEESNFGQMLEFIKIFSEYISTWKYQIVFTRYVNSMSNEVARDEGFYDYMMVDFIQDLCVLDVGNEESNFGQMKELVKELALIINDQPTYLATLIRYSVWLKSKN